MSKSPAGTSAWPPRLAGAVIPPATTRPPAPSAMPSASTDDSERTQRTVPGAALPPSPGGASASWLPVTDPQPTRNTHERRRIAAMLAQPGCTVAGFDRRCDRSHTLRAGLAPWERRWCSEPPHETCARIAIASTPSIAGRLRDPLVGSTLQVLWGGGGNAAGEWTAMGGLSGDFAG